LIKLLRKTKERLVEAMFGLMIG